MEIDSEIIPALKVFYYDYIRFTNERNNFFPKLHPSIRSYTETIGQNPWCRANSWKFNPG